MTTQHEPDQARPGAELPPKHEPAATVSPPPPPITPPPPPPPAVATGATTNWGAFVAVGFGVIGLVVGLLWSVLIGGLLGIVAFAAGRQGYGYAKQHQGPGKALAITGEVLGVLTWAMWLIVAIAMRS